MKNNSFFSRLVFALACTTVIIGFSASGQQPVKPHIDSFQAPKDSKDNTSSTRSRGNSDDGSWNFDRLDEQMKQLDVQMKNLDIHLKKIDMSKVENEIEEAMKKVDVEKISADIDKSMRNIDWENINNEVTKNMKVSKLKMAEVQKEMRQVRENIEKQKAHIKSLNTGKIKVDIEKAMKNAKISLEGVKEELRIMKEFTDVLEKDGLINKSKGYKIEVKEGQMYIDGKKQPKETSNKYKQYYRKSNFTIDMSGEGIRI